MTSSCKCTIASHEGVLLARHAILPDVHGEGTLDEPVRGRLIEVIEVRLQSAFGKILWVAVRRDGVDVLRLPTSKWDRYILCNNFECICCFTCVDSAILFLDSKYC